MKTKATSANNIRTLAEKKGLSARVLAKKIGTSAPHMSRLINGKSPLKPKWVAKIAEVLKVPASQIVGAEIKKPSTLKVEDFDASLLGSVMGWLMEACDEMNADLSRNELAKLTSLIYKESVDASLGSVETRQLASTAVKIKQALGK